MRYAAARIADWEAAGNAHAPLWLNCLGLTELPPLPPSLQRLYVSGNCLTSLGPHPLPAGLIELHCDRNQLATLGPYPLPDTLLSLWCPLNRLETLGRLPRGLRKLACSRNSLTHVRLPPALEELYCEANPQLVLWHLPPRLQQLVCDCVLRRPLPAGLTELRYYGNRALTHALPAGLTDLVASSVALFADSCGAPPRFQAYFEVEAETDWRVAWAALGRQRRAAVGAVLPWPALLYV